MGLEHLKFAVVQQGSEGMACWAACLSWYGKAVRHFNYSMQEIAAMYAHLAEAPKNGNTIGGMDDAPRAQMLREAKWRLDYSGSARNYIDRDIKLFMSSSPTLFTYWDATLGDSGGSHMNVIVSKVENSADQYWVMDPDYDKYQIRTLQYYTEKSTKFHLASLRSASVAASNW